MHPWHCARFACYLTYNELLAFYTEDVFSREGNCNLSKRSQKEHIHQKGCIKAFFKCHFPIYIVTIKLHQLQDEHLLHYWDTVDVIKTHTHKTSCRFCFLFFTVPNLFGSGVQCCYRLKGQRSLTLLWERSLKDRPGQTNVFTLQEEYIFLQYVVSVNSTASL